MPLQERLAATTGISRDPTMERAVSCLDEVAEQRVILPLRRDAGVDPVLRGQMSPAELAANRGLRTWFSRWTWVNTSLSSCFSSEKSVL